MLDCFWQGMATRNRADVSDSIAATPHRQLHSRDGTPHRAFRYVEHGRRNPAGYDSVIRQAVELFDQMYVEPPSLWPGAAMQGRGAL